jgi:ATP-dependent RNA helicase TDRD12
MTTQMQSLMNQYNQVLRDHRDAQSATYQILLYGNQWTPAVASFRRAFLTDPQIIITSRFEAAIYGKVKQVMGCNRPTDSPKCPDSTNYIS